MPWEGIPLGSSKNPLNHSFLDLPNSSMSTHESAPHTTAQTAIVMMSVRLCGLFEWLLLATGGCLSACQAMSFGSVYSRVVQR